MYTKDTILPMVLVYAGFPSSKVGFHLANCREQLQATSQAGERSAAGILSVKAGSRLSGPRLAINARWHRSPPTGCFLPTFRPLVHSMSSWADH